MENGETKTLVLTVAEINIVLGALGERPYKDVAPVVAKIYSQAQPSSSTGVDRTDGSKKKNRP